MKLITKDDYKVIDRQMANRSRDIDMAIYDAIFVPDFPKSIVCDALMIYQNNDGGFGNGLEIDIYDVNSSVYETYEALNILYMSGFSKADLNDELFKPLMNHLGNYLYNRAPMKDGVWVPVASTVNKEAHAPKYNYTEDIHKRFGMYPTIAIVGYTLWFFDEKKAYYKKAYQMAEKFLSDFKLKDTYTVDELHAIGIFASIIDKLGLFKGESEYLNTKLLKLTYDACEKDLTKVSNASNRPSYLLASLKLDDKARELLDSDLDAIISEIAPHGLWEGVNKWDGAYPEEASAMLKWIGVASYRNLYLLKKFNRIEE